MEEKAEEPGCPYFGLMSSDLTLIKPNYEVMIKAGQLKVAEPGAQPSKFFLTFSELGIKKTCDIY